MLNINMKLHKTFHAYSKQPFGKLLEAISIADDFIFFFINS